jgi:hypothetical protein
MLNGNNSVYQVTGISPSQEQAIKDFLQGAVYTWCNVNKNKEFLFRDLMGGDNYYWQNTPLSVLYDKYNVANPNDGSVEIEAGKDAGMLLKAVLKVDKNKTFDQEKVTESGVEKNRYKLVI